MSENLTKFLVDLASDSDRMSRFVADPGGELDGALLSADEKAALLARDPARLRRALGVGPAEHMTIIPKATKKKGGKKQTKKKAGKKK